LVKNTIRIPFGWAVIAVPEYAYSGTRGIGVEPWAVDSYSHATGRALIPPMISGVVLLVILGMLRGVCWLLFSSHECKGRTNGADDNTPGEGIAAGLAHLGGDVDRWTGLAAAVVFVGMSVWATVAIAATRRGRISVRAE
jgi:hypothetical protein